MLYIVPILLKVSLNVERRRVYDSCSSVIDDLITRTYFVSKVMVRSRTVGQNTPTFGPQSNLKTVQGSKRSRLRKEASA